jgi:hypothetical protein
VFGCAHLGLFNVTTKRKLLKEYYQREAEKGRCPPDEINKVLNPLNPYLLQDHHAIDVADTNDRFLAWLKLRWYWFWEVTRSLWTGYDTYVFTKRYGRDLGMYFQFQRLNIWAFTIISILATAILIPLHTTGQLPANYNSFESQYANVSGRVTSIGETTTDHNIVITSVNMVMESPQKMSAHVILAFVFIVIFCGFLVVGFLKSDIVAKFNYAGQDEPEDSDYRNKFNLDYNLETDLTKSSPESKAQLLSPFTIEVLGLPSSLIKHSVFEKVITSLIGNSSSIAHVSLIHDFSKREKLKHKLYYYEKRVDRYEFKLEQLQQQRKLKPPKKGSEFETAYINSQKLKIHKHFTRVDGKFKIYHEDDALKFYREKVEWFKYKLARWDQCFREQTAGDVPTDEIQENRDQNDDAMVAVNVQPSKKAGKEREENASRDSHRASWRKKRKQKHPDKVEVIVADDKHEEEEEDSTATSQEKRYTITGSGVGYVTFKSLEALEIFMKNYKQKGFNLSFTSQKQRTEAQIRDMLQDSTKKNAQMKVEAATTEIVTAEDAQDRIDAVSPLIPEYMYREDEEEEQPDNNNATEQSTQNMKSEVVQRMIQKSFMKHEKKKTAEKKKTTEKKKFLSRVIEKITIFVNR